MIIDRSFYKKHGPLKGTFLLFKSLGLLLGQRLLHHLSFPKKIHPNLSFLRGRPELKRNEEGEITCVSCGLCQELCPAQCIEIEKKPQKMNQSSPDWHQGPPKKFQINFLRCIYCGYCAEVCPVEALEISSVLVQPQKNQQGFVEDLVHGIK